VRAASRQSPSTDDSKPRPVEPGPAVPERTPDAKTTVAAQKQPAGGDEKVSPSEKQGGSGEQSPGDVKKPSSKSKKDQPMMGPPEFYDPPEPITITFPDIPEVPDRIKGPSPPIVEKPKEP